jgi:hypothetical protein
VTYTLAADGASDKVLLPILTWSLQRQGAASVVAQWVDFGRIPRQSSRQHRLKTAIELYPCDVVFVHRDAEGQTASLRRQEIREALAEAAVPHIPVVPVRMTEAWLLANELAIRSAAGNPNGREELNLPEAERLEDLPDPKRVLHEALTKASGLNWRRVSRFPVAQRVHLIPNYIDDYSRLQVLPAFRALQKDIRKLVQSVVSSRP